MRLTFTSKTDPSTGTTATPGATLRTFREHLGLTTTQAAKATNIANSSIRYTEAEATDMGPVARVARALCRAVPELRACRVRTETEYPVLGDAEYTLEVCDG